MGDKGQNTALRRELGDGLVLRSARLTDGSELADFNATMHGSAGVAATAITEWTRDLFDVPHPTFLPNATSRWWRTPQQAGSCRRCS